MSDDSLFPLSGQLSTTGRGYPRSRRCATKASMTSKSFTSPCPLRRCQTPRSAAGRETMTRRARMRTLPKTRPVSCISLLGRTGDLSDTLVLEPDSVHDRKDRSSKRRSDHLRTIKCAPNEGARSDISTTCIDYHEFGPPLGSAELQRDCLPIRGGTSVAPTAHDEIEMSAMRVHGSEGPMYVIDGFSPILVHDLAPDATTTRTRAATGAGAEVTGSHRFDSSLSHQCCSLSA